MALEDASVKTAAGPQRATNKARLFVNGVCWSPRRVMSPWLLSCDQLETESLCKKEKAAASGEGLAGERMLAPTRLSQVWCFPRLELLLIFLPSAESTMPGQQPFFRYYCLWRCCMQLAAECCKAQPTKVFGSVITNPALTIAAP